MTPTAPTAKTFREPLLRALGTLSKLVAATNVPMKDVLPQVYTLSGHTEDEFGQDNHGYFKTRLWVQQAYKQLVREDLALKGGRGRWTLSAEGVQVAATLLGQPVPTPPVFHPAAYAVVDKGSDAPVDPSNDTTVETPPAPDVDPVSVAPVHEGGTGVAYSLGAQVNTYNSDPYLRGLAIESTKCFGKYSNRSEVCKSCPLSGACKATVLSALSTIATSFRKRDAEANEPAKPAKSNKPEEEDIDDIIAAIEEEVDAPKVKSDPDVRKMKVPADTKCCKCGEKVVRGTDAMYERSVGIYHIDCYNQK